MHPWIKERAYLSKELYHHKERERERVQYVKGMVLNETHHWLHVGQPTSRAYTPQPPHEGCTKDEVINLKGLQGREFTSSTWAWALTGFSAVGQTPYQHWKGKRLQHELWMTICRLPRRFSQRCRHNTNYGFGSLIYLPRQGTSFPMTQRCSCVAFISYISFLSRLWSYTYACCLTCNMTTWTEKSWNLKGTDAPGSLCPKSIWLEGNF